MDLERLDLCRSRAISMQMRLCALHELCPIHQLLAVHLVMHADKRNTDVMACQCLCSQRCGCLKCNFCCFCCIPANLFVQIWGSRTVEKSAACNRVSVLQVTQALSSLHSFQMLIQLVSVQAILRIKGQEAVQRKVVVRVLTSGRKAYSSWAHLEGPLPIYRHQCRALGWTRVLQVQLPPLETLISSIERTQAEGQTVRMPY